MFSLFFVIYISVCLILRGANQSNVCHQVMGYLITGCTVVALPIFAVIEVSIHMLVRIPVFEAWTLLSWQMCEKYVTNKWQIFEGWKTIFKHHGAADCLGKTLKAVGAKSISGKLALLVVFGTFVQAQDNISYIFFILFGTVDFFGCLKEFK